MVTGRIGKLIDSVLVKFKPIADPQLFADSGGIFIEIFKNTHRILLQSALLN
jgi:hypothetical protein